MPRPLPTPDEQARRVVTAVTLYLLADAMASRLHAPGRPLTEDALTRSLEFAVMETQVRTGTRLPLIVC